MKRMEICSGNADKSPSPLCILAKLYPPSPNVQINPRLVGGGGYFCPRLIFSKIFPEVTNGSLPNFHYPLNHEFGTS